MNTENQMPAGGKSSLPCESAPIFEEDESRKAKPVHADQKDKCFAWLYLLVGYGFVYTFTSLDFGRHLLFFTVAYAAVVLAYTLLKGGHPGRESWFWLVIMLGIGVPYAFWSAMPFLQIPMLILCAAYWTLIISGSLLEKDKTSAWVLFDGWNALLRVPFGNFGCGFRIMTGIHGDEERARHDLEKGGRGKDIRYIFLGIILAVPVLLIVLPLLSSADEGFQRMIQNSGLYIQEHFLYTIARMILSLPVAAYLFGLIYGGIHKRNTDGIDKESLRETSRSIRIVPTTAIATAMLIVCAIYLLFIGLQGKYLFSAFAGIRPENFTYAEYARRGFFELCQTAVLNMILLLGANMFSGKENKDSPVLRWLNVLLSVLTLLLILTAMSKMVLYISAFGFTIKRVLTMVFMIWMAVVFTLVIVRQWRAFPMVRIGVIAGAVLYCSLCVLPVEHLMESYNRKYFPEDALGLELQQTDRNPMAENDFP